MRVMHNIPALQAYNALGNTNSLLSKSIERLSTGLRINGAADDAAGLAISEKMRAQIGGLDRATSNAQDGISMIQTAEGALSEVHSILQRMRELSVQSANDTLTQEDRSYIQLEIDQLKDEVSRISTTTQFNKKKLLDGSAAVLWSSDNLSTKALVHGGLRQIDQFGQKSAIEGNFKIDITADPGQSQIQKSDIFKIKHENVLMNLQINKDAGFEKIEINNLPAGKYNVYQSFVSAGRARNDYTSWRATNAVASAAGNLTITVSGAGANAVANGFMSGDSKFAAGGPQQITFRVSGTEPNKGFYYNGTLYTATQTFTVALNGITTSMNSTDVKAALWNSVRNGISVASGSTVKSFYFTAAVGVKYEASYGALNQDTLKLNLSGIGNNQLNQSMLFEVVGVSTASRSVSFRVLVNALDVNGKEYWYSDEGFYVTTAGVTRGDSKIGLYFSQKSAISISTEALTQLKQGDKLVVNLLATTPTSGLKLNEVTISGTVNMDWDGAWGNEPTFQVGYHVDMNTLANKDVHFKNFYLNTSDGTVYQGDVKITFNNKLVAIKSSDNTPPGKKIGRASFEAAYVGQLAKGDVKLRDLDKFWDANGKFMLDDPQQITIVQGNGKKVSFTLYSTDTLDEVRVKMNDAIAFGLGQAQYLVNDADKFVSYVEQGKETGNTPDAVAGTFVIRSLVPGSNGSLNFSGDEDIIKALSLNVIREAKENTFRLSISDAHSGMSIVSNEKVTGNILYGVLSPNVDVEFDSMANTEAVWNGNTRSFDLRKQEGVYTTYLHLADNTTVFQIGANQGEDMGVNIGDMSSHALGIDRVLVTDRESAARSITIIDSAITRVSSQRATLGAYQNRLEHTIINLTTASTNTTAAESRIRDADMAKEMMNFTKLNILSQAGNSMLAQANQLPQNVLSLLR